MYKGKRSETTLPSRAIGDESCREDRPIYVRVMCCGENEQNCWYVIEEKQLEADSSSSSSLFSSSSRSTSSSSSSDGDEEDYCNNDILECKSESDRIRRISVPDSELHYNSLVVKNSHIYLIGGDIHTECNEDDKLIGYKHVELGQSEWQLGGGNLIYGQFGAAVGHDGFIYSVGCHQYRLSPKDGSFKKLPTPPPLRSNIGNDLMYDSHLLALTKKKLFIYITGGPKASNLMFSYDLENEEWDDIKYPRFSGLWSAGVVLYDRYLFCFGSQDPNSLCVTIRGEVRRVVPGIYVYDIKERRWLSQPVEGLQTSDGTVLPYDFETNDFEANPKMYDNGPSYHPYLFQIGRQNDHKLALVWESLTHHPESGLPQCALIWSKFIITCKTNVPATTSDQDPQFCAVSLSKGFGALDEWTHKLLSCAAGV